MCLDVSFLHIFDHFGSYFLCFFDDVWELDVRSKASSKELFSKTKTFENIVRVIKNQGSSGQNFKDKSPGMIKKT